MKGAEPDRSTAAACPEQALAGSAARLLALLGVPLTAGAWLYAGAGGAAGALAGVLLVLVLFGLTGAVLGRVRAASPSLVVGVSLAGVGVRIAGYATALALLASVEWLHRPSLALAILVSFVATLAYEIRIVSRTPQFFWVRTSSG